MHKRERMLKLSISGDHEEALRSNLDLNAPLLSGRRHRATSENAHIDRTSSNLGSLSIKRPLVPFFTWEQPLKDLKQADTQDEPVGFSLAPPPALVDISRNLVESTEGANADFLDARSEFGCSEIGNGDTISVAPTYTVSSYGDDEEDALVPYNVVDTDKDIILRRFLPAAKAVADEVTREHRQVDVRERWRPLPSPLPQYRRQEITSPARKSFGELINMQGYLNNHGYDYETSSSDDDERKHNLCESVSSSVCGLFPLLKIMGSTTNKSTHGVRKKLELPQERMNGNYKVQEDDDNSTEWWSDQGEEAEDLSWKHRYTPSRGGLKSTVIAESRGFLGMPRDRTGRTFIRRMYPVVETGSRLTRSKLEFDVDSDSSGSLVLMKQVSGSSSRQSSSSEKIFCLDAQARSKRSKLKNGEEFYDSYENLGDFVDGTANVLYTPRREKKKAQNGGANYVINREEDDYKVEDELRICWHEEEKFVHKQPELALPTPTGPSQSWLKKKLVR